MNFKSLTFSRSQKSNSICHHQHSFFTVDVVIVVVMRTFKGSNSQVQTIIAITCLFESLSLCLSYHKTSTESYTQSKKLSDSNRIHIKGICFICSERFFSISVCSLLKCCSHSVWIFTAAVLRTMIVDFHGFSVENFKSLILFL